MSSNDQEEFDKLVKKLYALADKMGQRITITMRRKREFSEHVLPKPKPGSREPGDE